MVLDVSGTQQSLIWEMERETHWVKYYVQKLLKLKFNSFFLHIFFSPLPYCLIGWQNDYTKIIIPVGGLFDSIYSA